MPASISLLLVSAVSYTLCAKTIFYQKLSKTTKTYSENILSLLEDFGTIPDGIHDLLEKETCPETLKQWHKIAAKADSIEDFQAKIKIAP